MLPRAALILSLLCQNNVRKYRNLEERAWPLNNFCSNLSHKKYIYNDRCQTAKENRNYDNNSTYIISPSIEQYNRNAFSRQPSRRDLIGHPNVLLPAPR